MFKQLSRGGGPFKAYCDRCPDRLDIFETRWDDARKQFFESGWRMQKDDKQIVRHYCPACYSDITGSEPKVEPTSKPEQGNLL